MGWLKAHNYWSIYIDLFIQTTITKWGNKSIFKEILLTDIAIYVLGMKEKLKNNKLDDQLNMRVKWYKTLDIPNINNIKT